MKCAARAFFSLGVLLFWHTGASAQSPLARCLQMAVAVPESWESTKAGLMLYERQSPEASWQQVWTAKVPVLLGKNGLAPGRGVFPFPQSVEAPKSKIERDGKTPAGCFAIAKLHGYAAEAPPGCRLPYNSVDERDCWIDDPQNDYYNQHVEVNPQSPPPWYAKQRMRLGDFAYEFLLEIGHNRSRVVKGAGSAIFFHIRRGVDKPSVGCTTMSRESLVSLISRLDVAKNPHYAVLPRLPYDLLKGDWDLPAAD
jgi:L,D-peptidoglycan transpeptidase YkuD (ErfK/YbiS/YcfS/YnhG family)